MPFTAQELAGIVRALLAAFGGAAWFSSDTLTAVAGACVTLGVAVWSVLSKKKKPD